MKGNKPRIFIVSSTYNQLEDTKKLLSSIKELTYPNVMTYLIDDGSSDGTFEYVKEKYPEVILLRGDGNLWWTGAIFWGVNEILKIAKAEDFILTVNNDCLFDKDCLTHLVEMSQKNDRAIVGSLVIDSRNKSKIIDAGVRIDWSKGKFIPLGPERVEELLKNKEYAEQIDTLSTKGTLYPIEVFKKIGNFDKKHLPHYVSDYEFACRAKKNGFKLILSYRARVYTDVRRTGIGEELNLKKLNFKEIYNLLLSRRSRLNIFDQFWFITLSCPVRYKMKNYFLLFLKFIYLLSIIPSFSIFRAIALWIRDKLIKKYGA